MAETRMGTGKYTDSRCASGLGAIRTSNEPHYRLPTSKVQLVYRRTQEKARIKGFPWQKGAWCQDRLKGVPLDLPLNEGRKINIVHYIGIATDEPERIAKHMPKKDMVLPLVQIGWDEALCGLEAKYMDMLSPTYTTSLRDGCWFCHNQSVGQLRLLRKNYPDLWALLLKWDADSPVTFKADGHTVHDFDRRFQLEDEGFLYPDDKVFRWSMLDDHLQYRLF